MSVSAESTVIVVSTQLETCLYSGRPATVELIAYGRCQKTIFIMLVELIYLSISAIQFDEQASFFGLGRSQQARAQEY